MNYYLLLITEIYYLIVFDVILGKDMGDRFMKQYYCNHCKAFIHPNHDINDSLYQQCEACGSKDIKEIDVYIQKQNQR
ncbi:hypothetical protein [Bacillus sp. 03113]|uniref:hypothetical protein n=1 Tax=Bacillus sp. 03113 TaxID=2578211 RepID=UPI00114124F2|nr:hypothetical protein [Bacillus sp. 03113]